MIYKKRKIFQVILLLLLVLFFSKSPAVDALEIGDASAQINCIGHSVPVNCVITDPNGKRLGYDTWTGTNYNEFDGSFGFGGVGCIGEICEGVVEIPSLEFMFNLTEGVYTVEAKGFDLTDFSIGIAIYNNDASEDFDLQGITDKGYASTFKFTYSSTDQSKWSAVRVATPSSLKQDITLLGQIGGSNLVEGYMIDKDGNKIPIVGNMINNDGIMTSLLKKVEAIEASIRKGQTKTAKNQLNAFINEVKAQSGKHIDEDAVKMLIKDAQYIMDNL